MFSTVLDSLSIAAFIAVTGASQSPFFPLYYLAVSAVAMRFEMRQAVLACLFYAFTYALVYFGTWDSSADELGVLIMRAAYMVLVSVGVGHLAREENSRAREVEVIGRLNAENAKLVSKNERAARFDKLTGLLNRAYLEKDAQREVRKARSADGYLSVLFCDMDRLKRINDDLGHDAGDKVLRQVGAALRSRLRQQDLIGRYGGDEFVVLLPNLTRESAYDRADQLIDAVRQVNDGLPENMHVGLSVGVTTYPFDAQDYPTLVKVADQAMYLAKREGGNCVRTANDLRLFWEEMPRQA
jgi:diguanylate cyclase (GGDEF)-like protein